MRWGEDGMASKDGTEILIGSELMCVWVWMCVHAVSAEIQRQCGSVVVHSQAVMWANPPPRHLLSCSISVFASHSLSIGSSPEERLPLY